MLLMSHADVMPAVAANWTHPPFGAELAGGYVWGRGAIDNKVHGIMALMAMSVRMNYRGSMATTSGCRWRI